MLTPRTVQFTTHGQVVAEMHVATERREEVVLVEGMVLGMVLGADGTALPVCVPGVWVVAAAAVTAAVMEVAVLVVAMAMAMAMAVAMAMAMAMAQRRLGSLRRPLRSLPRMASVVQLVAMAMVV